MSENQDKVGRRDFIAGGARTTGAVLLVGFSGFVAGKRGGAEETVWQIDPDVCITCGNCAIYCVLDESAVKAIQCYDMCALCDPCPGYFDLNHQERTTAAENQLCPTGAVLRTFVAEQAGVPRFEYHIDEPNCIGCGKCVEGCAMMNGSLYLQVRHDRCVNCNQCSIAIACPSQAFRRVPANDPYLLKKKARNMIDRKGPEA